MKILVLGGAGYLGSILCKKLVERKIQTVCYDSLCYGDDGIRELTCNEKFTLIQGDIRDTSRVSSSMKECNAVIHLAGIVGAPAVGVDNLTALEINEMATRNIAELAQFRSISKFIFASSCSVYGDGGNKLLTESSPVNPMELYAKSKHKSEKDIHQVHNSPTFLRFGTLMGLSPRMRFDLVVNKFIADAYRKNKITVFGTGCQMRPFLHVSDAADSILLALSEEMDGVYNVLTDNMSIKILADEIRRISDCEVEYQGDESDSRNYAVSINKISRFGFDPTKTLHNIETTYRQITQWLDKNNVDYTLPIFSNYDTAMIKALNNQISA